MNPVQIARVCHDANRAYCLAIGDASQPAWEFAPDWQKASAIAGVEYRLTNPTATAKDMHDSWTAQKLKDGWTYGQAKDADKKTHPCLIDYDRLPEEQRRKDSLFSGIVDALRGGAECRSS